MSISNELEASLSQTQLTFNDQNWNAAQKVTIRGLDDDLRDGDQVFDIVFDSISSSDSNYQNLEVESIRGLNVDNDSAGIIAEIVDATSGENGDSASFQVRLRSKPTDSVELRFESSLPEEGKLDKDALTFTVDNWNAIQTIQILGQDDDLSDGDKTVQVRLTSATSNDEVYNGIGMSPLNFTNEDNDNAGIIVKASELSVTEAGTEAPIILSLRTQPTADVTVSLSVSDTSEGSLTQSTVVFTPQNWRALQTVRLVGADDTASDGDQTYSVIFDSVTSNDIAYNDLSLKALSATTQDNDIAGFYLVKPEGQTSEGGNSTSFSLELRSAPIADVTVSISLSDDSEIALTSGSLTFTPENWDTPQQITATGIDDALADGSQSVTVSIGESVSNDPNYSGLQVESFEIVNADNDVKEILISSVEGNTSEEGMETRLFVKLSSEPTDDVVIPIASSVKSEGIPLIGNVVFTPQNWDAEQLVRILGEDDNVKDGDQPFNISFGPAVSSDSGYAELRKGPIQILNEDNDEIGVVISNLVKDSSEAGGIASFRIRLRSQPTAGVIVPLSLSDDKEGTLSHTQVAFTTQSWRGQQLITVQGKDDAIVDGDQPYEVILGSITSSDPNYNGFVGERVQLMNQDNDLAGFLISEASGFTREAGTMAMFTARLKSQPTSDVTVSVSTTKVSEGMPLVDKLVFTSVNWDAEQEVFVEGKDDSIRDGDQSYEIVFGKAVSNDANYNDLQADSVSLKNIDNETSGFIVSPISQATRETGQQATFTIRMRQAPSAEVTIDLSSSKPDEGTVFPTKITFTPDNWKSLQTITVTGQDDVLTGIQRRLARTGVSLVDGDQSYQIVMGAAQSDDPVYSGAVPDRVAVLNEDDDTAGLFISPISGDLREDGQTGTFTVQLRTQPTDNVTLGITSLDTTEAQVSNATPVFTPSNWNAAQTITLTGINDNVADGDQEFMIRIAIAASNDVTYSTLSATTLSGNNLDDDSPGYLISGIEGKANEDGGNATFTVRLATEPVAETTLQIQTSDTDEIEIAPTTLTFNASNWNSDQTVIVKGVNDSSVDGNQVATIVLGPSTSNDPNYQIARLPNLEVVNEDNDTPGIFVSDVSGQLREDGGQAMVQIKLLTQPTENVEIPLSLSNTAEASLSTASLTFTSQNWSDAQTVTVSPIDDAIADGDQSFQLILGAANTNDTAYKGMIGSRVSLTNLDDDSPGYFMSALSSSTRENGDTATFTIRLKTQPTSDVTLTPSSSDTDEGTISPASVTFTSENWNTAQTLTLAGVDDSLEDGPQNYRITWATPTSNDSNYSALRPNTIEAVNRDDDQFGFIVSSTTGTTHEAGGTSTFTVKLKSQPAANVTINLSSSNVQEGTVSPTFLTFTPKNWETAQTVTVTGVQDNQEDDTQNYRIISDASSSEDANYQGLKMAEIAFENEHRIPITTTTNLTVSTVANTTSTTTAVATTVAESTVTETTIVEAATETTSTTVSESTTTLQGETTTTLAGETTTTLQGVTTTTLQGETTITTTTLAGETKTTTAPIATVSPTTLPANLQVIAITSVNPFGADVKTQLAVPEGVEVTTDERGVQMVAIGSDNLVAVTEIKENGDSENRVEFKGSEGIVIKTSILAPEGSLSTISPNANLTNRSNQR